MITAAFTDGKALICAIPSKSQNGLYLVKVEPKSNQLIVTHRCLSHRFKNDCSHVLEAVACYREWRWWDAPKGVHAQAGFVSLQPDWEQIPVPGSVQETALQVLRSDACAS